MERQRKNTGKTCDISVVITVKDRLDDLKLAVSSVFRQTLSPRELIIVDDCSVHPVRLEDLPAAPMGMDLKIIRNEPNLGGAASCNIGAHAAQGSFVAFLDSDDYFLPNYLAEVEAAWHDSSAEVVCIGAGFFWCTNDLLPYRTQVAAEKVSHCDLLRMGNVVGGSSVLSVRRDAFVASGGYPACRGSHDWGFLINISKTGIIRTIQKPLVLYRSPSTNPVPTYTKSYRLQLISGFMLYKMQTQEDRSIMLPQIRRGILRRLCQWRRRRLAYRVLKSILYHEKGLSKGVIVSLLILFIDPKLWDRSIFHYAMLRARLFGRYLLKKYGYESAQMPFV